MSLLAAAANHIAAPHIDWAGFSPILVLTVGGLIVLLVGLLPGRLMRERVVPGLTIVTLLASIGVEIWRFRHPASIISGALRIDDLSLELDMLFAAAGLAAVLLSWRARAPQEAGHGEYNALLLLSVLGMVVLVSSQNLITLFIGLELLSIPLYILCASETRREGSLESGLKYLVIGSVGSATLVYGLALVYGATGSTDFSGIAHALSSGKLAGGSLGDPMVLTGLGLVTVGFAFKASVAPFHQWTPDVYEGAPTPITAFMATATKAAALGVFIRFFDVAAIGAQNDWAPLLAAVAAITMIVGNVGALGQSSLKRMMGYSGVAQAGYMLGGVVVGTRLGIQATILYLIAYLAMNMAAFPVIVASELSQPGGDDVAALAGLGARKPWLAWPMTIGMLALAGIPGTVGFIGKFQLIHALVAGDYTWLAIVLVIGSMISLGYYLRVVASIWMRGAAPRAAGAVAMATGGGELAPIAGGSQDADHEGAGGAGSDSEDVDPMTRGGETLGDVRTGEATRGDAPPGMPESGDAPPEAAPGGVAPGRGDPAFEPTTSRFQPEVIFVAAVSSAACIFFGIFPSPLFNFAAHAGQAITGLF
jgi:NADH-quinone oxidoreductase subunit N